MIVDRARVVAVIRAIETGIRADRARMTVRDADVRAHEIVARACAAQGTTVDAWSAALQANADLFRLFDQALLELVVEAPDPGPYDSISRESPRGAPETDDEAFDRDARLLRPER